MSIKRLQNAHLHAFLFVSVLVHVTSTTSSHPDRAIEGQSQYVCNVLDSEVQSQETVRKGAARHITAEGVWSSQSSVQIVGDPLCRPFVFIFAENRMRLFRVTIAQPSHPQCLPLDPMLVKLVCEDLY
jgi:hypothetical protein